MPPSGQKLELVVRHGKILAGQITYQISLHTMHVFIKHLTSTCFIISKSFKKALIKSIKNILQTQCTQHDLCARVERAQFWSCLSTQSVCAFSDWHSGRRALCPGKVSEISPNDRLGTSIKGYGSRKESIDKYGILRESGENTVLKALLF